MSGWRSATAAILVSMAVHATVIAPSLCTRREPTERSPEAGAFLASAAAELHAEAVRRGVPARRQELLRKAREALSRGELQLGHFILEAQELDATEEGAAYPKAVSQQRYDERVQALREALARGNLEDAAPEVFGDLSYHGTPGGRMADALAQGGGSCEQIAPLVAAAAWDAGDRKVALRFWGGAGRDGVAHVAPVVRRGDGGEHDLMAGKASYRGGVLLKPEELIEVFARLHETKRPSPTADEKHEAEGQPKRASMMGGFPKNDDVYPGSMPLFARRAVQGRALPGASLQEQATDDPLQDARRCGYFVRMAALDPMVVHARGPIGGMIELEPRRAPLPERLENEAALLRHASMIAADPSSRHGDRLMAWACVVALGESAAVDFALAGEQELASAAMAQAREASSQGREMARRWTTATEWERARLRADLAEHAGRTWLLLRVEGGDAVLIDLLDHARPESWGKVSSLAGLLVHRPTRKKALGMVERYPLNDQVDVMHEVYHAHDHMAPWGSDFDLGAVGESEPGAEFLRAWQVFHGLAWRLWTGRRSLDEMLESMHEGAERAKLDKAWEAAFLEYTSRNMLGLLAMRQQGLEPVRLLRRAAERNGHASMVSLVRRLSYLEAQGELTAMTLADAWRN